MENNAPLGDEEGAGPITGVLETHLLPNDLILFTPAECDLPQGLRAESKPG